MCWQWRLNCIYVYYFLRIVILFLVFFLSVSKDTPYNNNLQLENQINTCFELRCKLEDYQEKLEELEIKGDYTVLCIKFCYLVLYYYQCETFDILFKTFWDTFYILQESSDTLMDFISNITNIKNNFGPEALIVVTSEEVGKQYINLIR